ncbi:DUF3418 domain-containing protein, partial [Enterobacter hormaechei]
QTRHAFFRENLKLRAEVEELEHKSRRRDILVDDETLFSLVSIWVKTLSIFIARIVAGRLFTVKNLPGQS